MRSRVENDEEVRVIVSVLAIRLATYSPTKLWNPTYYRKTKEGALESRQK
jgi:hypothetical protein